MVIAVVADCLIAPGAVLPSARCAEHFKYTLKMTDAARHVERQVTP
ncbi:hypothetical protein ABLE93_22620 [Xanthobacter sp. KR7-65]